MYVCMLIDVYKVYTPNSLNFKVMTQCCITVFSQNAQVMVNLSCFILEKRDPAIGLLWHITDILATALVRTDSKITFTCEPQYCVCVSLRENDEEIRLGWNAPSESWNISHLYLSFLKLLKKWTTQNFNLNTETA